MTDRLIVAVDGPSGAGKSSVCRAVAAHLGAKYLDTGAMYRVATLAVLRAGVDPEDEQAVIAATENLPVEVNSDPQSKAVLFAGVDVRDDIRSASVTRAVSAVSAVPQVRANLVAIQRQLAQDTPRIIMDGRDIGTNVLPDAPLKIFLTASAQVRAKRRCLQDRAEGRETDYEIVLADVVRRDELDSTRATNPLRPAADAVILDTSTMDKDEVIAEFLRLVEKSGQ